MKLTCPLIMITWLMMMIINQVAAFAIAGRAADYDYPLLGSVRISGDPDLHCSGDLLSKWVVRTACPALNASRLQTALSVDLVEPRASVTDELSQVKLYVKDLIEPACSARAELYLVVSRTPDFQVDNVLFWLIVAVVSLVAMVGVAVCVMQCCCQQDAR